MLLVLFTMLTACTTPAPQPEPAQAPRTPAPVVPPDVLSDGPPPSDVVPERVATCPSGSALSREDAEQTWKGPWPPLDAGDVVCAATPTTVDAWYPDLPDRFLPDQYHVFFTTHDWTAEHGQDDVHRPLAEASLRFAQGDRRIGCTFRQEGEHVVVTTTLLTP